MNCDDIWQEYESNGRLSGRAMLALKRLLRESHDPYSSITLAGDTAAFQLAHEIVPHISSRDPMVRWNAVGVLFTRFRDVRYASLCLELLEQESDHLVLAIALAGAGELLPLLEDWGLRTLLAQKLDSVFKGRDSLSQVPDCVRHELRDDAYRGIEAAVGLPPLERAPAHRRLDLDVDVKREVLAAFRQAYGLRPQ